MIFFAVFDILPLGSGSVDPNIFADPDPGSQNLANPTDPDPDPKHWFKDIVENRERDSLNKELVKIP